MTDLTDFGVGSTDDENELDAYRDDPPLVERLYPVRDPDGDSTVFGYVGRDSHRGGAYVYSTPRYRGRNYYRRIGGYPIDVDVLDRLRDPPRGADFDPVEAVYVIQRESTADHPPMTVFEYDLGTYLDAAVIDHEGFGEQRCPVLDVGNEYGPAAVWPAYGDRMFETGEL